MRVGSLRSKRLKSLSSLTSGLRCFASKAEPPAQGDTLRPEGRRGAPEIAKGAKGDELISQDRLKYNTITDAAQAFKGDLRSTSALGYGDGLYTHTDKWYQVDFSHIEIPMTYIPPVACNTMI